MSDPIDRRRFLGVAAVTGFSAGLEPVLSLLP